jgi:hypothetical protein
MLLGCLNGPEGTGIAPLERLSSRGWNQLLEAAARHGLRPLLYGRLTSRTDLAAAAPENVLLALREYFLKNGLRNTLLYQDLGRLLEALRQESIPVIVLKGAHLASLVYSQPALRQIGDIDVLVRECDLAKTAARLCRMGYSPQGGADPPETRADGQKAVLASAGKHLPVNHLTPFVKPPHLQIEVHWTIASTHPVRVEDLWRRARPASIAGQETLVLSPEDLLLHLCLHACQHQFEFGLRQLWDLRAVLERHGSEIDWSEIQLRTGQWRAARSVYVALRLARDWANAPVPAACLAALEPPGWQPRWLALARKLALSSAEDVTPQTQDRSPMWALALAWACPTLMGKLKALWKVAFPSPRYMAGYMAHWHHSPLTGLRRLTCHASRAIDWLLWGLRWLWGLWAEPRSAALKRLRGSCRRLRLRAWLERSD